MKRAYPCVSVVRVNGEEVFVDLEPTWSLACDQRWTVICQPSVSEN